MNLMICILEWMNLLRPQKLDITYHGISTHAAESPQFGKNALLSAANCILNLHSIPRNSDGQTRVNVGTVHAEREEMSYLKRLN